jgi:dihydrofolate reductase
MRVSIVVAMGRNRVIGTDAGLPWHLPRDLKQFRALTMGKPIVLGRKTLDQIASPLPGRVKVVLTRQPGYTADGARVAHTPDEALEAARQEAAQLGVDEVMVVGGGEVYRAFLPLADRLYVTVVDGEFEGTATFPADQLGGAFTVSEQQSHPADAKNPHPHTFWRLDRAAAAAPGALAGAALLARLGVA